jgi:hypothetical protein
VANTATVILTRRGGYVAETAGGLRAAGRFGTTPAPTGSLKWDAGQIDTLYLNAGFSVAAAGTLSIDLLGGGGELDLTNRALSLAKVLWLYLELSAPASGAYLKFGPLGVTNAWQGPWGGVAAANYSAVPDKFEQSDPSAVWPVVDATHKVLTLSNPTASAVAGTLLVGGLHT